MGLLDSLFDSSSYSGGDGLLARLAPMLGQLQQSQGFQDQPASFADRFGAMPQQQGQPPASFANRFNAMPDASPISVGGYQMPRMGAASMFQPSQNAPVMAQDGQLPPNAQPTQGQLPQQAPQQQPQQTLPPALGGSGNSPFMAGLQSWANTPAGNPIAGLVNGITGAVTGQRNDPAGMQQQNLKAQFDVTRQALLQNGETPERAASMAMLSVLNPKAAETIYPELLSNKEKYQVVSENPIEGKKYGFVNDRNQTVNGQPMGQGSSGQNGPGLLAPGVAQFNPNLSGNEYLGQFSPEVQAAVKSYMNGDVLPSGNPRQQGIASQAKTIAQKYGADLGIPVSDALYSEKRKYRTELGSNSANSAGGQAKAFNQGISHLSDLADKLEKLDNSNGMGIPAVAGVVNYVRQGTSTQQAAISDEAKGLGQTVAGEVGKLFSGSSGGGVHERELTRDRFDTVKSKPQLAAALRATIETMQGGLSALEQNRDRILGPNSGVDFVGEETRAKIAKIQSVIDRLEGKAPASAPAQSSLPQGWSVKVR